MENTNKQAKGQVLRIDQMKEQEELGVDITGAIMAFIKLPDDKDYYDTGFDRDYL